MATTPQLLFEEARREGRKKLLEHEALMLCEHYGLPVPKYGVATNSKEAVEVATKIGFPVVMKVISPDIVHKSDVGGVALDVKTPDEAREKYMTITRSVMLRAPNARVTGILVEEMLPRGLEMIVGASRDPFFGPIVMIGVGGIFVEVLKDVSFRVAPLTPPDAYDMLRDLKGYSLFGGFRGMGPLDEEAVVDVLMKVSEMITQLDEVAEIDINPLLVFERGRGAKVADVRFILGDKRGE
ncbi:acetate--CoA ligase family protein [Thermofilum sp.]|uniref:acetate--CoA ligase family protein n=1 Tax=Thermofilum sp. TaxID=1961369 RepID=UPI00258DEA2C|nr:acetate--CoA ligase family protein [Thermofilum sp.]